MIFHPGKPAGYRLQTLIYSRRRSLATTLYAAVVVFAYLLAFLFRFDFNIPHPYRTVFEVSVIPFVAIRLILFHAYRLTRERWRYVGTRDIARLVVSVTNGSGVIVIFDMFAPAGWHVPLSVIVMEAFLTSWCTAALWVTYRMRFERVMQRGHDPTKSRKVLVIGAGEAGNTLVREMLRFPTGYVPVGFVDDDAHMWGATVQGLEVFGATSDVRAIAETLGAEEIILAIPSALPTVLRRVVELCDTTGLPFKVLPGIREVLLGNVSLRQLREVRIEDLLGREPIELELPELAADLAGKSVLITGAAGSIGSELARQVALHDPAVLILFDQAETDLFYIDIELRDAFPAAQIVAIIGDIFDAQVIERVFSKYKPDRVFHAAAYKHVPLMQHNPIEAIRNNVLGTWRVAETAGRHDVGKFILVSTDKAVRPANVMGATKRVAELIVLELQSRYANTSFGVVRFGNVLGSNGSVLPIFRKQIQSGKPLTVTHPETTRYFMTVPEAVQLILQSSILGDLRGHIAMLDMGDPVRITDLATNLLRLSGMTHVRKHIIYTGLRPGEKLHEELCAPDEEAFETSMSKVRILKTGLSDISRISSHVEAWEEALRAGLADDVVHALLDMFPGLAGSDVMSFKDTTVHNAPASVARVGR